MAQPQIKYGGIRNEDLYPEQIPFDYKPTSNLNRLYNNFRNVYSSEDDSFSYTSTSGMTRPSQYDDWIIGDSDPDRFNEQRAMGQGFLDKLGNGLGKAAVFAGTSFIRNSLGFISGLMEGNMHDNTTTQLMQYVENWADEVMPLYSGLQEQNKSWLGQTVGSMNWWMEALRSAGIMMGAGAAGGVWGRAFGLISQGASTAAAARQSALLSNLMTSFISSSGEAGMEANEITKNMFDEQRDILDAKYDKERQNIINTYGQTDEGYKRLEELNSNYSRDLEEIQKGADKAGQATYWSNIPILMAENMFMFGKAFSRSFKNAAKLNGFENSIRVNGRLGKYAGPSNLQKAGGIGKIAYGPISEFNEEMLQNAIKKGSEMYYTNNRLLHPDELEDERETFGNLFNSITESLKETYTDPEAYKEGLAGLVMGITGGVMPRSPYNNKTKKWQSPFTLEGGLYQNIKDYKSWIKETNELAKQLNDITSGYDDILNQNFNSGQTKENEKVNDDNKTQTEVEQEASAENENSEEADGIVETTNYYKKFIDKANDLTKVLHYRNAQENALQNNDVFSYKNAEFAELFSHINTFAKAGRLQDLKDMLNTILDTDNEALVNDIIEQTSKDITNEDTGVTKKVGPYVESDGSVNIDNAKQKIKENRDYFIGQIDNYANYIEKIQNQTSGLLSDKQVEELAYMHMALDNMKERSSTISDDLKTIINAVRNKFNIQQRDIQIQSSEYDKNIEQNYTHLTDEESKKILGTRPETKILSDNLDALEKSLDEITFILKNGDKSSIQRYGKKLIGNGAKAIEELNRVNKEYGITFDNNVMDMFADLISLVSAQQTYDEKLIEFLNNPENIEKDNKKNRSEKIKKQAEEKINSSQNNFKNALNKVKTLSDVHKLIQQTLSDLQAVSSEFTEDDILKGNKDNSVIKEYQKANSYKNALSIKVAKELKNRKYPDATIDLISRAADAVFRKTFESLEKNAKDMINQDFINQHINAAIEILSEDINNIEVNTNILQDIIEDVIKNLNNVESASSRNSSSAAPQKPKSELKPTIIQKQTIVEGKIPKNTLVTDGSTIYETTGDSNSPLKILDSENEEAESSIIGVQKLPKVLTVIDDNFDSIRGVQQSKSPTTDTSKIDSKPTYLNTSDGYIESSVSEYDWNALRSGASKPIENSIVINHIKDAGGFELIRESKDINSKTKAYYLVDDSSKFSHGPAVFIAVEKGGQYIPIMKVLEPGQTGRKGHEQYDNNSMAISQWLLDNYSKDKKNFKTFGNQHVYTYPFSIVGKKSGTIVYDNKEKAVPLSDFYGNHIKEKRGVSKKPDGDIFKIINNDKKNTKGVFLQYQLSDGTTIDIPVRPRSYTEAMLNEVMLGGDKDIIVYKGKDKVSTSLGKTINGILNINQLFAQGKNIDEVTAIFKNLISDLNRLTYKKNHLINSSVTLDKMSGEFIFKINSINLDTHKSEKNRVRFYPNTDPKFIQNELYNLLCGGNNPYTMNIRKDDIEDFDMCAKMVTINTTTLVEHNPQVYVGKWENGKIVPFMYSQQQQQAQTNPSNPVAPTNIPAPKNTSTSGKSGKPSSFTTSDQARQALEEKMSNISKNYKKYKGGYVGIVSGSINYLVRVREDVLGNISFGLMQVSVNTSMPISAEQFFTDLSYLDSIIPAEAPKHTKEVVQQSEPASIQNQTTGQQKAPNDKSSDSTYKVKTYTGTWTRKSIENQQDEVFLFGDNTDDRINTKYIPKSTQAVIRGLPNAIGIDTKKSRGITNNAHFTDNDFEEFKKGVDEAINKAKQSGKTIVIPVDENGNPNIGTGKASLQTKAPKCFNYLQSELNKLLGRDVQSTPAEISTSTSQSNTAQSSISQPNTTMNIYAGDNENTADETTSEYSDSDAGSSSDTELSNKNDDEFFRQQSPINSVTYEENTQVLENELSWIKEALPQIQDKIEFVDNINSNGDIQAWGVYKNNAIKILKNAPEGTIYHEAFHYVFHSITDSKKRSELLSEIKKIYGEEMSDLKAEETLAEEFREYMQTGNTLVGRVGQKIKNFFKNLLDFLHITTNNSKIIDTYFRDIRNGKFADSSINVEPYKKSTDSIKQKLLNEGLTDSEIENLSDEELAYVERCY